MTLVEALEIAIAETGHARFEWLCSIENLDVESRLAYRDEVYRIAGAESPRPPLDSSPPTPCSPCWGTIGIPPI